MNHTLDDRQRLAHPLPGVTPAVRQVGLDRPMHWLRLGARDVMRTPGPSLGLGLLVAAVGLLLSTMAWQATYIAPALLGGFLLVGPFLAITLYGLTRQLEDNEPTDLRRAWQAMRGNAGSIALFGLLLALAYIFWERLAAILFAFYYDGQAIHLSQLMADVLLSGQYLGLMLTFLGAGALLAIAVFAFSVVSAPLLVDRPVDVITAALTSLQCCLRNPAPMLLWAALIVALVLAGFLTLMLGLIFVFPLLAHASWHAYRDMVEA
ncbi:DUF2189 domain-containing protein [Azohydromonas caseinilytica]|uniref:DUF2189 domain-containing protein n=1 Tax=Azohydromonas caseinilytica TaxID=2728836 RepID=A0A848FHG4_9BURK|nr:DUF2189 domain-containing protein [Azohydromonas caseinilytica]NML18586.1 DUF2189 domain-containing protein [Azohydromonas caseinilytica]